jgi:hypothetical protein
MNPDTISLINDKLRGTLRLRRTAVRGYNKHYIRMHAMITWSVVAPCVEDEL